MLIFLINQLKIILLNLISKLIKKKGKILQIKENA